MSEVRSQAIAGASVGLAGTRATSSASNLTLSARAYAAGHTARGERFYAAAFLEVRPLVEMTVRRYLPGVEDREDAVQVAMLNIWCAVQKGRDPAIALRATGAAIDKYRHEERRATLAIETWIGDTDENQRDSWLAIDDQTNESDSLLDADTLARAVAHLRPIWGDIVRCIARGLNQAETARHLGRPAGTITRNVVEIRRHLESEAA